MREITIEKRRYDQLVHLWPITVEFYPTGKVAFIARPGGRGKRWNKTFSTATFGSPEEAANQAIEFCKRVLTGADEQINQVQKIREEKKAVRYQVTKEEMALHLEAKKLGIDVAGVLNREIEQAIIGQRRAKWEGRK